MKNFDFLQQFCNWGHDESKVPNETMIKLHHVVENLNVF
jgi:hypothetical protein